MNSKRFYLLLVILLLAFSSIACLAQTADGEYQLTQEGITYLIIGVAIWFVIGLVIIPFAGFEGALTWWYYTFRIVLLIASFGKINLGGGDSGRIGGGGSNSRRGG